MSIQKAAAIGVCAALIALQFKGGKTEYGIYVSIAAGILLGAGIIGKLGTVLDTVKEIGSFLQIEGSYLGVLLKMLGITYVAEFASNICKDSGCQTIAAGDSHNDLAMIRASKAGFLFRSTEAIKAENPDLPALDRYDDLLTAIEAALEA